MNNQIRLSKVRNQIEITDNGNNLDKAIIQYLRLMKFQIMPPGNKYVCDSPQQDLFSISKYLQDKGYEITTDSDIAQKLEDFSNIEEDYKKSIEEGLKIKNGNLSPSIKPPNFNSEIEIKPYQLTSIYHMLNVKHAANFSVPGSGKTLMTYAVYDILKQKKQVDSLLVVGPISSFGPWEQEYTFCLNNNLKNNVLRYHATNRKNTLKDITKYDVVLTSYETASNDIEYLKRYLMNKQKVMMVIDESHHIKSFDEEAKHANSMIDLGNQAVRRYILSGTPIPHSFKDLWSQITFLWPAIKILFSRDRYRRMLDNFEHEKAISDKINFLWTRVTNNHLKNDLPQLLSEKNIAVPMSKSQEIIYSAIERDIWKITQKNNEVLDLFSLRKNRIMRLLQSVTNPHVLMFSDAYNNIEKFYSDDSDLNLNITDYDEISPKITKAAKLAIEIAKKNANVVIWTIFVKNVEILCDEIRRLDPDVEPIGISGKIPNDSNEQKDIVGREERINYFKNNVGKILVATAGSIAESISLHKTCHCAIYLERNFNAGQYMQSLSRIYRIGSDKMNPVQFIFLHSVFADKQTETIDSRIDRVLKERIQQMHLLLNDQFNLHKLDLDGIDSTKDPSKIDEDGETDIIYDDILNMIEQHKKCDKI